MRKWQKAKVIKVDMLSTRYIGFVFQLEDGERLGFTYNLQNEAEEGLLRLVCRVPKYYVNRFPKLLNTTVEVVVEEKESEYAFPSKWLEIVAIRKVKE